MPHFVPFELHADCQSIDRFYICKLLVFFFCFFFFFFFVFFLTFLFDFLLTEVCATYNEYGNSLYTSLWNVY